MNEFGNKLDGNFDSDHLKSEPLLSSEAESIIAKLFCDDYESIEKDEAKEADGHSIDTDSEMNALFADDFAGIDSTSETETLEKERKVTTETTENTDAEKKGLTEEERAKIKEETGWSDEIIDHIQSMEQYEEVYKNAGLHEEEINGRKCLVKDINMDYVDPKTVDDRHPNGMTNRELMESGRPPYDEKTGERIELHHMGQEYDSPFAELCENSEHGDGKDTILHDKDFDSWRNDPQLKNKYNNSDRPNHWMERAGGSNE